MGGWLDGWMNGWMDVHGHCQTRGAFLAIVRLWFGAFLKVLQLSLFTEAALLFPDLFSNH